MNCIYVGTVYVWSYILIQYICQIPINTKTISYTVYTHVYVYTCKCKYTVLTHQLINIKNTAGICYDNYKYIYR